MVKSIEKGMVVKEIPPEEEKLERLVYFKKELVK